MSVYLNILLGYDGVLEKRFGILRQCVLKSLGKALEFFVSKRVGTLAHLLPFHLVVRTHEHV